MKIFENYNSAKQKYGVDLVDSLNKVRITASISSFCLQVY